MKEYLLQNVYEIDLIFNNKLFGEGAIGKLKLSPDGISFSVISMYKDFSQDDIDNSFNKLVRVIHCETLNHQKITLFNSQKIGFNGSLGLTSEIYNIKFTFVSQYCIIGEHFNSLDKDNKIAEITIKQNTIKQWIDQEIVTYDLEEDHSSTYKIEYKPPFYESKIDDNTKINFFISASHSFNAYKDPNFDINYFINYYFGNTESINSALTYINNWEILFSIFMGQTYDIDAISFKTKSEISKCYLYYIKKKNYPYNLHFLEVPLPCEKINKDLGKIFLKWYAMNDKMKRSAILFHKALNQLYNGEEDFLSAIKALEGFTDDFNATFFDEEILKTQIIPNIKESLKKILDNNKNIKDFAKALKNTNKHKYSLEAKLQKLIESYNLSFLNLDNKLISHLVSYRNTLSHNGGEERYKNIDNNIMHEGYMKLMISLFILFMNYLEISNEDIEYAINRNKILFTLSDNKLL